MTMIAEINDRAACATWCPLKSHPDVVALGAKDSGGIGFEDTGGELELFDMNLSAGNHNHSGASSGGGGASDGKEDGPKLLGSVKTAARFASVAWTTYTGNGAFPMGLLAGGMTDGSVHFWDPVAIIENPDASLVYSVVKRHSPGPVKALQFNPLQQSQLATGGSNGQVLIVDLAMSSDEAQGQPPPPPPPKPGGGPPPPSAGGDALVVQVTEPATGHKQSSEITAVAWNTQVTHIVASSSGDGSVAVWDLKSRRAWCELRAEHAGQAVADLSWNPAQGLHLLTASADDRNPVIKVWDLGASTSMPLATLSGHQAGGLLRTHWCPHDDTLLLTCARDNRTLLWDLYTLQAVAEVPNEAAMLQQQQLQSQAHHQTPSSLFSSNSLAEQKHMRYDVQWSPLKRGLALTCSLDRKVQVHSVVSLATKSGRPPKWMKPASAVTTGFGGTVISCGTRDGSIVTIRTVQERPQLAKASDQFETQINAPAPQQDQASVSSTGTPPGTSASVIAYCHTRRAAAPPSSMEGDIWGFMRVIFEHDARQHLKQHLGYDYNAIASAAAKFTSASKDKDNGEKDSVDEVSTRVGDLAVSGPKVGMTKEAEEAVKEALMVGNLEAAVECCFQAGNLSDALILASWAGADLWAQTQERYFKQESPKRPYLSIVSAIIRSQLAEYVAQSSPKQWHETLAILSTYATSEEFPNLCIALGDRLEEAGDPRGASLCYMCSLNLEKSVKYWKSQLDKANQVSGSLDLLALHEFVVKVTIFLKAVGPSAEMPTEIADLFTTYSQAIAEQGLFVTAARYCKGQSDEGKLLRDRLYRSRSSHYCLPVLGSPPEFPFTMVAVDKSRGQVYAAEVRQAEAEAARQREEREQQKIQQEQQRQAQQQQQQQQQQQSYGQSQAYSSSQNQASGSQQQYSSAQYGQQQQTQTTGYASDQLPPGWMELQDPSSGMPYYYNQNTQETTWERPQAVPSNQPAPAGASYQQQGQNLDTSTHSSVTSASQASGTASKTKAKLVSKYGDGFVTSASHPELAYQYGNVGTSNPYHGVERPGTAAAVVGRGSTPEHANAPVSGTLNLDSVELPNEHVPLRDSLLDTVQKLHAAQLSSADKRQLSEAEKGVAILVKKLARGGIGEDTLQKISAMTAALVNRDYATAINIQTDLVSHDWKAHKDWLKGIKFLIQLASKKVW